MTPQNPMKASLYAALTVMFFALYMREAPLIVADFVDADRAVELCSSLVFYVIGAALSLAVAGALMFHARRDLDR